MISSMCMANDDFFQLLDSKELNEYFSKYSSKKIRLVLFFLGLILGTIAPQVDFNNEEVKFGILGGLIVGFIWVAFQFKKYGEVGIYKMKGEVFVSFVYIVFFFFGVVVGQYLMKPLLTMLLTGI